MSVAKKTLVTPEQLLVMPDSISYELVDGELRERHRDVGDFMASALTSWVGFQIVVLLGHLVDTHRLGWVFSSHKGYQCFPNHPGTLRRPDASFVKLDRLGPEECRDGWLRVVPDLVVEVVSPHDLSYDLERKLEEYRRAEVPLIWVVIPPTRSVRIIRADGTSNLIRDDDLLTGEGIIPGFVCRVADLFLPATPDQAAASTG